MHLLLLVALGVGLVASLIACTGEHTSENGPAAWSLELELDFGTDEKDVAVLSEVRGVGVDGASRVYVLDSQEQVIVVFDSSGVPILRVGGRGDGPGEFRGANGIAVDASDQVWVYDPVANRITIFNSSGVVVETRRIPVSSYGYRWTGGVDSLGRIYDEQVIVNVGSMICRSDIRTGQVDTLARPYCGVTRPPGFSYPHGYMPIPFASGEYVAFDARGILWCADTGQLRVYEYDLGDTIPRRVLEASGEPASVSTRERDSVIDFAISFMKYGGAAKLDFSMIPSIKPMIESISMDDNGRVWVRTQTREGLAAFVFDGRGSLMATVPLPQNAAWWLPLLIYDDHLYTVNLDSLDVPVVARYRIRTQD